MLPIEYIETELLTMIIQLIEINRGLQILPNPMKNIGSSVGVIYDNKGINNNPRFVQINNGTQNAH